MQANSACEPKLTVCMYTLVGGAFVLTAPVGSQCIMPVLSMGSSFVVIVNIPSGSNIIHIFMFSECFLFLFLPTSKDSVNILMDQILADVALIKKSRKVENRALMQEVPMAMIDSILGLKNRWSNVQTDCIFPKTIGYVANKAAMDFMARSSL